MTPKDQGQTEVFEAWIDQTWSNSKATREDYAK